MHVPFRTFAVLSLAFGLPAAAYLLAPAPGATPLSPPARLAAPATAAPDPKLQAASAPTLVASRPPVPLVTPQHTNYFAPADQADSAQPQTQAAVTDQPSDEGQQAKRAIEFDGYKNVRAVVKGADGVWHARAQRGRTEIAVRVDASGNVSAE